MISGYSNSCYLADSPAVFDLDAYKQLAAENDRLRTELEVKERECESHYRQVRQIQEILSKMTQIIAELKGDRVKPLL